MRYAKVTSEILDKLKKILSEDSIITDSFDMEPYSHDESIGLKSFPEVVVKPETKDEVAKLLSFSTQERIPLTPRGGGTGVVGGAVPIFGGILLSMERMNKILEIDPQNSMTVVQSGVINGNLQGELKTYDLFYPVNPSSSDSCTIGGNVAHSSSGANAVKYGGTKNYVCGLETVLPSGEIIRAGGKLLKNVTDYRMIQFILGSEGTLGVITEITLRVVPLPLIKVDLIVILPEITFIEKIVKEIMAKKIIPTSIEYLDSETVKITKNYLADSPSLPESSHYLLIEVDGFRKEEVEADYQTIGEICLHQGAEDVLVIEDAGAQGKIWKFRQSMRDALFSFSPAMIEGDVVVPRSKVVFFLQEVKGVLKKWSLSAGIFGHLGDGNVHINILKGEIEDKKWEESIPKATEEIFHRAIYLGGKISGEHGIGLIRKPYLPLIVNDAQLNLMRRIKRAFDPENVLNPGKIFDM